jgi:uncharacterized protein
MMNRAETLAILSKNADAIRSYGATALHLFGSAARDEMRADSDIDLFIDYVPDGSFTFVELIGLQEFLAAQLQRDVDLTTRAGLHPRLKERIVQSSVRVF